LLNNLNQLVPVLKDLAKRHTISYKVLGNQYGVVGETLLATLGELLKEKWTATAQQSWLNIYCVMLSVLIPTAIEEEKKLQSKA